MLLHALNWRRLPRLLCLCGLPWRTCPDRRIQRLAS